MGYEMGYEVEILDIGEQVEILGENGKVVDCGVIEIDNFDDTAIVDCERMGLVNVPKDLIRKK